MSGSKKPPLICWDSCIFLAWFNQEKDKPLTEIEGTLREVSNGKIRLLISAISFAEVLDKAGGSDAGTQFKGFVKRPNVILADVDPRVGLKAADIRQHALLALENKEISQGIKIPDALIVATALIYRADVVHTFDPLLLEISGKTFVNGLPMIRPNESTTPLGF